MIYLLRLLATSNNPFLSKTILIVWIRTPPLLSKTRSPMKKLLSAILAAVLWFIAVPPFQGVKVTLRVGGLVPLFGSLRHRRARDDPIFRRLPTGKL